jgi:hypothetical protein
MSIAGVVAAVDSTLAIVTILTPFALSLVAGIKSVVLPSFDFTDTRSG